ncbi:MAG: SurA N-terminal domain-containing protein [Deferrisomatales bacterium]|nr:SurA N-terminal domain-containing protein [Deferrisomatales bacterium]
MLELIRRNVRHPYIQALLGLVILVFIFFFGWSMQSEKPSTVAKVNGEAIEYRAYQRTYNGLVKVYQDALKEAFTPERARQLDLGRRALDQLVDQTLLLQEAGYRGIKMTDTELQAAIQGAEAFQRNGAFDKRLYLQLLDANRLTPLEYEGMKRQELLLGKVDQAIRGEAAVSDAEVEQEYRDRNTKIELAFVALRPAAFEPQVEVADAELADYFSAEAESFRTPETRAARYLLVAPEPYLAAVEVPEQAIEEEFRWRASEFAVSEAVHARHILFQVAAGSTPEQEEKVRLQAESVRNRLLGGADFAALARELSNDPGSKDSGGDLGFFERGRMVPEFEQAAFALEPDAVSEPVKTSFGYHLIRVEERREAQPAELEAVRAQLDAEIRRRKALEEAYAAADNILMDLEDHTTTWEELATRENYRTTGPLRAGEPVEGVEQAAEFVTVLFGLGPDRAGELLETSAGTYLLAVAEYHPAAIPALDQVRDAVVTAYRKAEAMRLAAERAKALIAAAGAEGWDAATANLTVETTEGFAKKGGAVPKIGWAPELKEAAFALTEVGQVAPEAQVVNGVPYVLCLHARTETDLSGLEGKRESLRNELLPGKQNEHYQDFLKELRQRADLVINEGMLL